MFVFLKHLTRLLKINDFRQLANMIYRILPKAILDEKEREGAEMSYAISFYKPASPYLHRRIGHAKIIDACKMIDYLITNVTPLLITPEMAEWKMRLENQ